ncbi:hypothetical protein NQZ70_07971 [Sorangium sp. Soce836]|nr:hypothetical protein NQZ70_07971 [Sorangium sp. Soce836]
MPSKVQMTSVIEDRRACFERHSNSKAQREDKAQFGTKADLSNKPRPCLFPKVRILKIIYVNVNKRIFSCRNRERLT